MPLPINPPDPPVIPPVTPPGGDPLLAVAAIANDQHMQERMTAAVTQVNVADNGVDIHPAYGQMANAAIHWVTTNRYVWAATTGWGAAWNLAAIAHQSDSAYQPGADPTVITDAQIKQAALDLVGTLGPGPTSEQATTAYTGIVPGPGV
jgi:hypothetical protein